METDPDKFARAVNWSKRVQRKAFRVYNDKLRARLRGMDCSDRTFWNLVKEIGGLDSARSSAAPDAEALADHFAQKMTSGKDREDQQFIPINRNVHSISTFKIRYKQVFKSLRKLDSSKSTNGAGTRFLKQCAEELVEPITKLFKLMASGWCRL